MKFGMEKREIKPIGLGCWAIGGPFFDLGAPAGWGDVKDEVSLEALKQGIEMGVSLIDTANIYGAGHSERLVGKAIKGMRDKVILTTKFGILCDEETRTTTGQIEKEADIRFSCEESLRRLGTDYIDVFLFHIGDYPKERAPMVRDVLEDLVKEGKIRSYGWSTSDPERAAIFAKGTHAGSMEFALNVMEDDPGMVEFCRREGMSAICRSPLAMGLLTGKYHADTVMPDQDLRGKNAPPWMNYYIDGRPNEAFLNKLNAIREILTSGGRTLAQGCIAWVLGRGEHCIPIPGFKTPKQVEENVKAVEYGPLLPEQMKEIEEILGQEGEFRGN